MWFAQHGQHYETTRSTHISVYQPAWCWTPETKYPSFKTKLDYTPVPRPRLITPEFLLTPSTYLQSMNTHLGSGSLFFIKHLQNYLTSRFPRHFPHALPPSHHLGLHPRAGHLEHERRGDGHKHIYSLHAIHDRSPASITATKRWDTPPGTTGCAFRCAGTWNTNNTSTHL